MIYEKGQREMQTVWWQQDAEGEAVCMIDQSLLPGEVVILTLTHEQQVAHAISNLKVRGAPAIGVTAAFGMALALYRLLRALAVGIETDDNFVSAVAEILGLGVSLAAIAEDRDCFTFEG